MYPREIILKTKSISAVLRERVFYACTMTADASYFTHTQVSFQRTAAPCDDNMNRSRHAAAAATAAAVELVDSAVRRPITARRRGRCSARSPASQPPRASQLTRSVVAGSARRSATWNAVRGRMNDQYVYSARRRRNCCQLARAARR